jgi:MraZ protein
LQLKSRKQLINLLGTYSCKMDAKGRFMLPKGLKEQLGKKSEQGFVVGRDVFSKSLVIYTSKTWKELSKELHTLNRFVEENVEFLRRFSSGATGVELDNQGRLSMPGHLIEYANLEKDLIVTTISDRIELWDKKTYNDMLDSKVDMGALSEKVMGDIKAKKEDSE